MKDQDTFTKTNTDAVIKTFRARQEADALALVASCANDEATLLLCKRALQTLIDVHQETIAGIDAGLNAKQS